MHVKTTNTEVTALQRYRDITPHAQSTETVVLKRPKMKKGRIPNGQQFQCFACEGIAGELEGPVLHRMR